MASIQRQDSSSIFDVIDDDDGVEFCLCDGLLEAPTLSSKDMERAREQALKVMKTKSPEDALKIFTEVGVGGVKPRELIGGAGGQPSAAVPLPPPAKN